MPEQFTKALQDLVTGLGSGVLFVIFFNVGAAMKGGTSHHIPPWRMMFWTMIISGFVSFLVWLPSLLRGEWRDPLFPLYLQRTFIIIIGMGLGAGFTHWLFQRKGEDDGS